MARNSSIEWCHHTVNFWWGCEKVSSACKNCYAEEIDKRFGPKRDFGNRHWGPGASRLDQRALAESELHFIARKDKRNGTVSRVFINSMSDWLDAAVPIEWLTDLLATLDRFPNQHFLLLTKRPHLWRERLEKVAAGTSGMGPQIAREWLRGFAPKHLWIGTTVEDQTRADERIPALLQIPAQVRFLSCEPLLGPVNIFGDDGAIDKAEQTGLLDHTPLGRRIHWVIAGGESGTKARPTHPDWLRSLRDQCDEANVPFLFKQWGAWSPSFNKDATASVICTDGDWLQASHMVTERMDDEGAEIVYRVGKKESGRLLDGREHNEFPTPLDR